MRHATLLSLSMALVGATCHAEANPPVAPAAGEPARAVATDAADAAVAPPNESVLALRRAAVTEGAAVVVARADALARTASPDDRALLRWVAATLDPDEAAARARFEEIAAGESPLAAWGAIEAARRTMDADPQASRVWLARFLGPSEGRESSVGEGWAGRSEAVALDALAQAALALASSGGAPVAVTVQEAEAAVREALRLSLSTASERALSRALADLLATSAEPAQRREAVGLYLDLISAAPRARTSQGAESALDALVAGFPDDEREALRQPSLVQARAHASYLEGTQQHRAASDAHAAVAARLEPGSVERCAALLDAGRALHRGRINGAAIDKLDAMIGECGPALERAIAERGGPEHVAGDRDIEARRDALAWAHYALGRAAISSSEGPRAIVHLEAIAALAPGHRLVDDGLVYAARVRLERGERERAHDAFRRAIDVAGDMRGEARFLLAWDLRKQGQGAEALVELEQSLAEGTGETAEGIVGRAAYWRARLLVELGRERDGLEALEALVRARPLTYYAQLAMARLGERDAPRRDAVRRAVLAQRAPLEGLDALDVTQLARAEASRSIATRLVDEPARATFARAQALLAVDELGRAERELAQLGLVSDGDLAAVSALASLLTQSGHAQRATDLSRRRLGASLVSPSDAEALALFRTAYPPAYAGLIEDAAGSEGVDPSLVRAVAREESSFNPDAVSVAHAYGLLQIIRPTAQRHARPLGLASDPAALRTPSVNVRIGARYMGALRRRYDGQAAFIPPAYNAGEGNVDRWMRERSDQPFDVWVEEMPFGETRGYTRRVLQSWIVYSFLDRGELPELPAQLPRRG